MPPIVNSLKNEVAENYIFYVSRCKQKIDQSKNENYAQKIEKCNNTSYWHPTYILYII